MENNTIKLCRKEDLLKCYRNELVPENPCVNEYGVLGLLQYRKNKNKRHPDSAITNSNTFWIAKELYGLVPDSQDTIFNCWAMIKIYDAVHRNSNTTRNSNCILSDLVKGVEIIYLAVLDYAFDKSMKACNKNTRRLLSGERHFIYDCYKCVMNKKFDSMCCNIFYSYLVLRTYFRGEFIQINKRVGFANFSDYQDRKEIFIEGIKPYEKELLKLAVEDTLAKPYVKSLEARICPNDNPVRLCSKIKRYSDILVNLEEDRFFYVLHFAKLKDKGKFVRGIPRDYKMRCQVERQAKSIAFIMGNFECRILDVGCVIFRGRTPAYIMICTLYIVLRTSTSGSS